ncbi:YihY/virulence factor BrkB family protein [Parafrankia elaeagni]|uniref:YihY/virulence factor BrkB family protein n=1 Tax=Parafrankia elaeagni TaxID=222534 RepID=UPI0003A8A4D1|nr:YhjD/YihY/BrkB family envelope integrity protein [Parafrankia elaeagni]
MKSGVASVGDAVGEVRRRRPLIDHAIRAYGRYTGDGGDRVAASTTYFAFLSFFPIMALVFSITGFVVDAYPDAQAKIVEKINDYLPGLADRLDVASIGNAKVGAGLIGLAGLLLAGLAWLSALRDSIRIIWHQSLETGNFVLRRLKDVAILAGLGLALLASLVVTSLATSATGWFLRWIGLEGNTAAAWVTGVLAVGLALVLDMVVFVYIFWRLPEHTNRHRVLRAALLGALGVELLKLLGTWLVGQTTSNPVYGAFAVIVGLLIWINIMMRWMLFVAAWAVTAPFDSDVDPSGTASTDSSQDPPVDGHVRVPATGDGRPATSVDERAAAAHGGTPEAPGPGPDGTPAVGPPGRTAGRGQPGRGQADRPPTGGTAGQVGSWRQRWLRRRQAAHHRDRTPAGR